MHPLEHRLEQALSEIDSIKQILRDHSRKLEETESTVKQVEGHHEVHENLAQRTAEKLDVMKEQFLESIEVHENLAQQTAEKLDTVNKQLEQLHLKFQQFSASAHKSRRQSF